MLSKNKTTHTVLAILLFGVALVYLILPGGSLISLTSFLILPAAAAIAGFYAVKAYGLSTAIGRAMFWISLGILLMGLGEATWYLFDNFLNIDPYPSLADFFYLASYIPLLYGIYSAYKTTDVKVSNVALHKLLSTVILLIAASALVGYFLMYQAYDPEASGAQNTFTIAYGVADFILIIASSLALIISSAYKGGKLGWFWAMITMAFAAFLVGDILFGIYTNEYSEYMKPYIYIDLSWTLGYFILALAMAKNIQSLNEAKDRIKTI